LADQLLRYLEKTHLAGHSRENRYQATQATGREKLDFAPALTALGGEYDKIEAHLTQRYGESWRDVFQYLAAQPTEVAEPWLVPGLLRAELRYFIHEEMAITLADVVFRRTGLASAECPSEDVLRILARAMAEEFAWDEAENERQIAAVLAVFAPLEALRENAHV
jgi:glycerol-3-phosphate dehydrogenase